MKGIFLNGVVLGSFRVHASLYAVLSLTKNNISFQSKCWGPCVIGFAYSSGRASRNRSAYRDRRDAYFCVT